MITTLLVANRGEIARRIIRTASGAGIRTVAVFTDPDADAPHVREADMAIALGEPSAYLDIAKIVRAATGAGADAVHPGYGFLSENAAFARACADAGLTFVGPSPAVIETMGRKDRAKRVARAAGVPVLADAAVTGDDPAAWLAAAKSVGYPLLVKATAGGGGKGMRLVSAPAELAEAVAAARREAASSFGDPGVFLERYLTAPRHVEIQVFGDASGHAVYLNERECSVQRRHQKIIEEAPSPAVDEALRERMGTTAVSLVRELRYCGAGTVEYLLDDGGQFYFLEMNTRLQVEHPVTEEITGLDLVRLQLTVAGGEPLSFRQEDVRIEGHAVEARLYAEDPARDFAPCPGVLHRYRHGTGVRWEDGTGETAEVSPFYDPMLAKVIAHAPTRREAALKLARALASAQLHGTTTNASFLVAALRSPAFLAGQTRTDFVARHPELLAAGPTAPEHVHLAAAVAVTAARRRRADLLTPHAPPGFRPLPGHPDTAAVWVSAADGGERRITYRLDAAAGQARLRLTADGVRHDLSLRDLGPDGVRVRDGAREWPCQVAVYPDGSVWVNDPSGQRGWQPRPRLPLASSGSAGSGPVADMAGVVVAVKVRPGDEVTAGQQLVVVEAMKMEWPAVAAADGVVETVHVSVGEYVAERTVLVTLGPAARPPGGPAARRPGGGQAFTNLPALRPGRGMTAIRRPHLCMDSCLCMGSGRLREAANVCWRPKPIQSSACREWDRPGVGQAGSGTGREWGRARVGRPRSGANGAGLPRWRR